MPISYIALTTFPELYNTIFSPLEVSAELQLFNLVVKSVEHEHETLGNTKCSMHT